MKKIFYILLFTTFMLLMICSNFFNRTEQQHTILSIDKIEATEGDPNGFRTRVYYQVSTDKGAYHIRTVGLNAAPQCIGIKKDSTYTLTTQGISIPIFGIYPCIVKVKEE